MTQQYTTDYDQSQALLKAGLDKETADYYFPAGCKETAVPVDGMPLTTEVRSWSMGTALGPSPPGADLLLSVRHRGLP